LGCANPEQIVNTMIRERKIVVLPDLRSGEVVQAGDWMGFFLEGKGIAGHGQVASVIDGAGLVRDSDAVTAVAQLAQVEIFDTPKPFRMKMPHGHKVVSISRDQFAATCAGELATDT
jgi:hypothetical protein